jgi:NAD(P)-dependent dehydrogenase (short-subunit alcohol dehydrogenase family)
MLTARSGVIIVTSSVKGSMGSTYRTAYAASKGGIDALIKVVATSYGKHGIRCNAIAPGIIETEGLRRPVRRATHRVHPRAPDPRLGAT